MRSLWPDYASLKNRNQHTRYMPYVQLPALVTLTLVSQLDLLDSSDPSRYSIHK